MKFYIFGEIWPPIIKENEIMERKVYIAVMTGAPLKYEIEYSYIHWGMEFFHTPNFGGLGFFGDSAIESSIKDIPYISVDISKDKSLYGLCSKLYRAIEEFLFRSDSLWMIRICEDTAVNIKTLPLFLEELNSQFDPMKDVVIQGACLGKQSTVYLQGGSGFVFSRKAAFDLYKDWSWFNEKCSQVKSDDRVVGIYLQRVGISPYHSTNRWFLGHSFLGVNSIEEALLNRSQISHCIKPISNKGCRSFFTKLKDITFWHDRVPFDKFVARIELIRELSGDDLAFYVPNNKPVLCLLSNDTHLGYYD